MEINESIMKCFSFLSSTADWMFDRRASGMVVADSNGALGDKRFDVSTKSYK